MTLKLASLRTGFQISLQLARMGRKAWAAVALSLAMVGSVQAQGYANVTIGGAFAPGIYGQISLGNNSAPPVWNAQPMIVGRPVHGAPVIYLHVPQEQYRDWRRYCGRYHACGRPVHFVRVDHHNRWWEHHNQYRGHDQHYRRAEERRDEWRHDRRDDWRHDRRDDHRDNRHNAHRNERHNAATDPRHESKRGER